MDISVVIPVYNEEENLREFADELLGVLKSLKKSFEVIFIDDGSKDRSSQILRELCKGYPFITFIRLNRNYGQHSAIFCGFEYAKGDTIITIDADLQNPPSEIPKLLEKIDEGYEAVGGYRESRQDSFLRKIPSFIVAKITSRLVQVPLKDYGCMLRAYKKDLVEAMISSGGVSTYIPALANSLAGSVAEVPIEHRARTRGTSKYNLFQLLRLNFDIMTGFSLIPIQWVGVLGFVIASSGLLFSLFLLMMRLIKGSVWAAEGVFTLFGILFFFVGIQILVMGLMGEYIGRIYQEVRKRPRYRVQEVLTQNKTTKQG